MYVAHRWPVWEYYSDSLLNFANPGKGSLNYYGIMCYIGFAINQTFPALTYKTLNGFVSRKGNCPRIYIIFLFLNGIKTCESNFHD